MVLLSDSATAVIALALTYASLPALRLASRRPAWGISVLGATILGFQYVNANFDRIVGPLLSLLGRDPTLTGRTRIWEKTIEAIGERSLTGYGHSAFWGNASVVAEMKREIWWAPPTAHNGYLDLLLSVGMVGFVLFAVSVFMTLRYSLKYANRRGGWLSLFPAAYVVFLLVYNSSESITGVQPNIMWILYVVISVSVVLDSYGDQFTKGNTELSFQVASFPNEIARTNWRVLQ
jgi:O-antigen ligase